MYFDEGYADNRFEKPVSQNFHCPICMNVLKKPVMCQNNQHHFCTACIVRHLETSQTCPTCRESLMLQTLKEPLRIVNNCLSELKIRCDYFSSGCQEYVRLEHLETHVINCTYCPVECSNEGCLLVTTKRDQEHHETQVCNFRKVKCDNCIEMRQQLNEMKSYLALMKDEIHLLKDEVRHEVRGTMAEMKDEIKTIRHAIQGPSCFNSRGEIVITGGEKSPSGKATKSVEIFNWHRRTWNRFPSMLTSRKGAFSFVYGNQIIVCGGSNDSCPSDAMEALEINDAMEALETNDGALKWSEFPAKLSCHCIGAKCVVLKHHLLIIGGNNDDEYGIADGIFEVSLNHPFTSKLITRMPQPRSYHGAVILNDKVLIVGGSTSDEYEDSMSSVLMYDVNTKECCQLAPLPFAVSSMGIVGHADDVILLGGCDRNGVVLDRAMMYNVKTEKTVMLPPMKYKRAECPVVITGNMIIVMGGYDHNFEALSSVECFSFDRYIWKDLPPMIMPRSMGSAVVLTKV